MPDRPAEVVPTADRADAEEVTPLVQTPAVPQPVPAPMQTPATDPDARVTVAAPPAGFWTCVRADVFRALGRYSFARLVVGFLRVRTLRPVITLRLCQAASRLPQPLRLFAIASARLAHRTTCQLAGIDLPWRTRIGPGFLIAHGWGLVVSHQAVIGRNCTLMHGVTLGRKDRIGADGARQTTFPVLGDEVFVGPHAIIVGGVTIGDGARVAGAAVVVTDVPAHAIVGPVPATILRTDAPPDVVNRATIG